MLVTVMLCQSQPYIAQAHTGAVFPCTLQLQYAHGATPTAAPRCPSIKYMLITSKNIKISNYCNQTNRTLVLLFVQSSYLALKWLCGEHQSMWQLHIQLILACIFMIDNQTRCASSLPCGCIILQHIQDAVVPWILCVFNHSPCAEFPPVLQYS
jgi:hypothetical protein